MIRRETTDDPPTPRASGPARLPSFAHLTLGVSTDRVKVPATLAKVTGRAVSPKSTPKPKPQATARIVAAPKRSATKPVQRTQEKRATTYRDWSHLNSAIAPAPRLTQTQLAERRAQREERAADRALTRALAELRGEAVPRTRSFGLTRAREREIEEMVERCRRDGVIP